MKNSCESQCIVWPFNLLTDLFGEEVCSRQTAAQEKEYIVRYVLGLALAPRNEAIVRMRYEKGLSTAEIGERYRISAQQVSAILERAFRTLQKPKYALRLKQMPQQQEDSGKEVSPQSGIEKLNLKTRLKNSLLRKGICSVEELMETDLQSLMKVRGIGAVGIADIAKALEDLGLDSSHLRMSER